MNQTYQIQPGDTFSHVAAAHHVSLSDLEAANPQVAHPDLVQAGEVITIPAPVMLPTNASATNGVPPVPSIAPTNQGAHPVNITRLDGHIPANALAQLPQVIERFAIDTPVKLAHFLAQCAHESCGFTATSEGLNYGPQALHDCFHIHFDTPTLCNEYAHKPEAIANRAYANRMGNGDEASKDGWKYRGRGYLQLTGRANYGAFSKFVGEDVVANPDLVQTKYSWFTAAWFFQNHNLFALSSQGATDDVVKLVTHVVNGGYNGLDERKAYFHKFYPLLSSPA